jgi:hypothetical protein
MRASDGTRSGECARTSDVYTANTYYLPKMLSDRALSTIASRDGAKTGYRSTLVIFCKATRGVTP